jgi:hypothetical protein
MQPGIILLVSSSEICPRSESVVFLNLSKATRSTRVKWLASGGAQGSSGYVSGIELVAVPAEQENAHAVVRGYGDDDRIWR